MVIGIAISILSSLFFHLSRGGDASHRSGFGEFLGEDHFFGCNRPSFRCGFYAGNLPDGFNHGRALGQDLGEAQKKHAVRNKPGNLRLINGLKSFCILPKVKILLRRASRTEMIRMC